MGWTSARESKKERQETERSCRATDTTTPDRWAIWAALKLALRVYCLILFRPLFFSSPPSVLLYSSLRVTVCVWPYSYSSSIPPPTHPTTVLVKSSTGRRWRACALHKRTTSVTVATRWRNYSTARIGLSTSVQRYVGMYTLDHNGIARPLVCPSNHLHLIY